MSVKAFVYGGKVRLVLFEWLEWFESLGAPEYLSLFLPVFVEMLYCDVCHGEKSFLKIL